MFSDFTFDVNHRPCKDNLAVDAMSRLETEGADSSAWDMDIPTQLAELQSALAVDTATMVPIAQRELVHAMQHDDDVLKALERGKLHGYAVVEDGDGLIVRKAERVGLPPILQALVPVALQDRVLKLAQQPQASSHPDAARMFWTLRTQFYWTGMQQNIKRPLVQCRHVVKQP